MSKTYIHYGSDKFDIDKFHGFEKTLYSDLAINKPAPKVGLWGSPTDCWLSWRDWCEGEEFHTEALEKAFTFTLSPSAKILTVRRCTNINPYLKYWSDIDPMYSGSMYSGYNSLFKAIDFQAIFDDGYDGVELVHSQKYYMELHMGPFYSWDVDSIVVWNPDVIIS